MAAWLIAAIERLPPRARRVVVAATALLLLAGAITSLTLQAGRGREAGRSAVTVRAPARRPAAQPMPPRLRPPVSGSNLRLASRVARRFLLSYLKFAYGRARAASVEAVTPGLRSQLMRDRAQVTPAERARHPRVVSLAHGRNDARVRRRDGDDRGRRDRGVSAAVCAPGRGRPVVGERCAGGVSRDGGRDPPARRPRARWWWRPGSRCCSRAGRRC